MLSKLKGRIQALKEASTFNKAPIAEAVLDEAYSIIESQQARLNVLEAHLQTLQRRINDEAAERKAASASH